MNLTKKEKQALNELINKLKKKYRDTLSHVLLYGSYARGDANKDSDIDIMVVLRKYKRWDKEFEKISDIKYPIASNYDLLISTVILDEKEYIHRNTPLLLNVRKEGRNLYEAR